MMIFEPCVPYHWQIRSKHVLFLLYPFRAKLGLSKQFTKKLRSYYITTNSFVVPHYCED